MVNPIEENYFLLFRIYAITSEDDLFSGVFRSERVFTVFLWTKKNLRKI